MRRYTMHIVGSEHTLPFRAAGETESHYVTFSKVLNQPSLPGRFETEDAAIIQLIEDSAQFKEGTIRQYGEDTPPSDDITPLEELSDTSYPDIAKWSDAKAILTGEPYNVAKNHPSLRSAEGIRKKATELGIDFPNLTD